MRGPWGAGQVHTILAVKSSSKTKALIIRLGYQNFSTSDLGRLGENVSSLTFSAVSDKCFQPDHARIKYVRDGVLGDCPATRTGLMDFS